MRKVLTMINIDEAFAEAYAETNGFDYPGPGDYLEREFKWLDGSGITLDAYLIADADDECKRGAYLTYLAEWIFAHQDVEDTESPLSYEAWRIRTRTDNALISEYTAAIIDVFEDVLSEHDMYIPDDFREGEEGEACIYGDTYYQMEEKIKKLLEGVSADVKNR